MFCKFMRALLLVVMGLCFLPGLFAQKPGTTSDPLVSKSYLDHFFRFRSVVLPAKSVSKPEAGAMFIVRSGKLILTGPRGKAVVDLTTGKEIPVGKELPLNHLIIIPDSAAYELKAENLTLMLAAFFHEEAARD
jgi:hypothetical protein